ncbi:MAG: dUTPase [Clostridiales bacterium]|jgi:dimeric dUTPase (all-alpha-NTP-PPase superfamily)|nr:dUTPase [Clostridiales bacterium]
MQNDKIGAEVINNDKLETIFHYQNLFDSFVKKERNLNFSKEEWIQKEILATLSELSELLTEVNFKWWKNPKPLNEDNIKDELVDILHFFVGMCLNAGMSADELFRRYLDKNKENFNRQNGLSEKKGYEIEK